MRITLTVADPFQSTWTDVVVEADGETPISGIARRLAGLVGARAIDTAAYAEPGNALAPWLFVNGELVSQRHSFATSPLLEGSVVSLHNPMGCLPAEPLGSVEVRVAGGPDAGAVHRLSLGYAYMGSAQAARVRVNDPAVPPYALRISVDARGAVRIAPHEGATATLDREMLVDEAEWLPDSQVSVGSTLLELSRYSAPDAALTPSDDGVALDYNRPPRMLPPERTTRFNLPNPPEDAHSRPIPLAMVLAPVLMSVVMAVMLHRPQYLLMAAMSPMMMLGNYFGERKQGRKSHTQSVVAYREKKARIEQDAREALRLERAWRQYECPDPAMVLDIGTGPRKRLWERRRDHPDHLLLRVGTLDQPSEVVLNDPEQDDHRRQVAWTIPDAPVRVPLRERGVVGVAGPGDTPRSIARWLVAQTMTLSSPDDVQFFLLTDKESQRAWEWVRWLPHARPRQGRQATALIGTDAETVAQRIAEISHIVSFRVKETQEKQSSRTTFKDPDILVVLDGSRRFRALPGMIQILAQGPAVGVRAICLDAEERFLPGECQAVIVVEEGGLRVSQAGEETIRGVRPDAVSPAWCQRLVRGLSAVRDVSESDDAVGIPAASRLLDVLDLEPPTPEAIAARWRLGGSTTMALLGESYDGRFGIDIRRDGPHGLIAGTTGSGKSELLQTIVASLAVANTPDAMTFVLVDYKGGSAFKDCEHLPHTVGMVTDLDNHLVERALTSLGAELKRREHILAAAGAKDIEDYGDIARKNTRLAPMPRLLIVIDEFASMARELPDFVTGLVNIAQRGRSLGIHLLLATQRPSGVVSPEIRANTNLRIALRVTDAMESSDVIDAPDAGNISKSTPGRAYVRLGANSLVPFQAGRVGGRRPGTVSAVTSDVFAARLDWTALAGPPPARPAAPKGEEDAEITDLKVLVEAIRTANDRLGLSPQHSPWLPALPESVLLDELPPVFADETHDLAPVPYGVDDLPASQARRAAVLDFATLGHMLIGGAPQSGRSQVIRTMAGSIARTHSSSDVHIYGIDCGSGALLALTALPHCGAVVQRQQSERATRLITRLSQEIGRRQEMLSSQGFAGIVEQRLAVAPDERLPHILVFLDRWDGFVTTLGELDNGALGDAIQKIMREGQSAGVHLVMTGDRLVFSGRIGSLTEDKMTFRLPDRTDFSMIGINPRKIPDKIPVGRAYRADTALETHIALLTANVTGQGQAAALAAIGEQAKARDAAIPRARRPFRIDVLPARLTLAEAWELRDEKSHGRPMWAMVGVGGDELVGAGPDLLDGLPAFLIGGPPKSGRSTLLQTMARTLIAQGSSVVLMAPRTSPLRAMLGEPGVLAVFEKSDTTGDELEAVLGAAPGPVALLVDDAEMMKDAPAGQVFKDILVSGAEKGRALVAAGSAEDLNQGFGGWHIEARKARRGVLLSPQGLMDGDLIGARLPRSAIGAPVQPGRAFLNLGDGGIRTVQVPID